MTPAVWRKSSFSNFNGNCVEVRPAALVGVRDSTSPRGPVLSFTEGAWVAFLAGLRSRGGAV